VEREKERRNTPKAAAYREHPSDQTSVLAVIVQLEGTSNSSGALSIVQSTRSPLAYHSRLLCAHTYTVLYMFGHKTPGEQGPLVCKGKC